MTVWVEPLQIIDLTTAIDQIQQACEENREEGRSPFFFLVGAGISNPPIPLASEIVEQCKATAKKYNRTNEATSKQAIDKYSHWFLQAYPQPIQRQKYLRKLIEGKPISDANFRLAHVLLETTISNIIVTPNFDDFLSKALTLFGKPHIVCDHPNTISRIDPEQKDIQIIHVHGVYWFYDCCNLVNEIEVRSLSSSRTILTMASLLDRILSSRSPIVIGYGGWENDVIMSSIKRRLQSPLPYNLYWFCYRITDIDSLPEWLKSNPQVFFVVPKVQESTNLDFDKGEDEKVGQKQKLSLKGLEKEQSSLYAQQDFEKNFEIFQSNKELEKEQSILSARQVFDKLIETFKIKNPELTTDPLGFYAKHLRSSLIQEDSIEPQTDIYSIRNVIERIERAKQFESTTVKEIELQLEKVREAIRGSQYKEAIKLTLDIDKCGLTATQLQELMKSMLLAASMLSDNSNEKLLGYDQVVSIGDTLCVQNIETPILHEQVARALVNKGYNLGTLNRSDEAISVYDEVVKRFGDATELLLREGAARALFNKGARLGALNRSDEAISVYDEIVKRFGEAPELTLREQVVRALVNKGTRFGALKRNDEAISVYDEIVKRFGDATELPLREQVARALVNKGHNLGTLNRSDEAISVYDEVVKRFGEAPELTLREQVARALVNKGYNLGTLNRSDEAISVYDEVVKRFGDATELLLREGAARALFNKGARLGALNRSDEAISVYDEIVKRFGDATDLPLREQVATALFNKGYSLGALNRNHEEISVYNEIVKRFGDATDLPLREQVARALVNKGYSLGALNRSNEAISVYDEVVKRFGEAPELTLREQVARVLFNKGYSLGALNRNDEAIIVFDEIVKRFGDSTELPLREIVANAFVNKGYSLGALNRSDEAISVYDEVVKRFGDSTELPLREHLAKALVNKSYSLGALNRNDEAISVYDEVVKRFGDSTELPLREIVANALFNKGYSLGALNRNDEEISVYNDLVKRFGEAPELSLREEVATALFNKGYSLGTLNCSDEAISVYDEIVKRFGDSTELPLREIVANALVKKVYSLGALNRSDEAISVYDEIVKRFGDSTELPLREIVANALVNKGITLMKQGTNNNESAYQQFKESLLYLENSENLFYQLNRVIALSALTKFDDAERLLNELDVKVSTSTESIRSCLSDLEVLASSPNPPDGISQFLEKARKIIEMILSS